MPWHMHIHTQHHKTVFDKEALCMARRSPKFRGQPGPSRGARYYGPTSWQASWQFTEQMECEIGQTCWFHLLQHDPTSTKVFGQAYLHKSQGVTAPSDLYPTIHKPGTGASPSWSFHVRWFGCTSWAPGDQGSSSSSLGGLWTEQKTRNSASSPDVSTQTHHWLGFWPKILSRNPDKPRNPGTGSFLPPISGGVNRKLSHHSISLQRWRPPTG